MEHNCKLGMYVEKGSLLGLGFRGKKMETAC